jgi:hypothetical protein
MVAHLVDSPEGQAELARHGLTSLDLATAIDRFQQAEGRKVGTWIGINEHGFFGSAREGWRADRPGAFAEPLLNMPWVQILELLGRVPAGTTAEFLESEEARQGGGGHD